MDINTVVSKANRTCATGNGRKGKPVVSAAGLLQTASVTRQKEPRIAWHYPGSKPKVTGQTYHVKLHIWDKVTAGNEINAETRPGGRIIVFIKYQSTKIITMPVIFMPAKSAAILLLVLGTICLVDGIIKKDTKEILVALATLAYSVYKLVTARKKKQDNKSAGSTIGKPRQ